MHHSTRIELKMAALLLMLVLITETAMIQCVSGWTTPMSTTNGLFQRPTATTATTRTRTTTFITPLTTTRTATTSSVRLRAAPPVEVHDELGCSPTLSFFVSRFGNNINNNNNNNRRAPSSSSPAPFVFSSSSLPPPPPLPSVPYYYYFDPLNLATDENFAHYREAELKHGRVSMLAIIGILVAPSSSLSLSSLPPAGNNIIVMANRLSSFLSTSTMSSAPHGEDAAAHTLSSLSSLSLHWDTISLLQVLQVMIVCGILETHVLIPRDPQDIPGDYGLGYFGIRDIGRHERSLMVELEHGRLAMMAFLYWLLVLDPPPIPIPIVPIVPIVPMPIQIPIPSIVQDLLLWLWKVVGMMESGTGAAVPADHPDTVVPDALLVFSSFGLQETAQTVWESTVNLSPPLLLL